MSIFQIEKSKMKNLTKVLTILLLSSINSFPFGTFQGRRTNMIPDDHQGPKVQRVIPHHHHHHHHQQQLHHHHRHQRQKRMKNETTEETKRSGTNRTYHVSQSVYVENIVALDQQTAPYDLFGSRDGYYHLIPEAMNSTNTTGLDPRPSTSSEQMPLLPKYYPVSFKVVGSFFVGLIFLTGVLGNVMVVLVVVKMRSMHTPTNCYLMSLAVADLLLLIFACLPTLVDFYTVQDHFLFGWFCCKLMVFAQYLSVNLSSLSMTAFTVERYVAICHPMIAHRMCTVRRANKIIVCLWLFGLLYCSPWVVVISVKPLTFDDSTVIETCTFNLKRSHYATYYVADLLVFYVVPLFVNSVLYVCIGKTLYHAPGSGKVRRAVAKEENTMVEMVTTSNGSGMRTDASLTKVRNEEKLWIKHGQQQQQQHQHQYHHDHGIKITTMDGRNRIQVIKMLAVVVAMFAILWLPYRGYVVYNSFAKVRFECSWCMLACRLMIYMNSAINPVLYNAMSSKFRRSFLRLLFFGGRRHLHDHNLQMKHVNSTND